MTRGFNRHQIIRCGSPILFVTGAVGRNWTQLQPTRRENPP